MQSLQQKVLKKAKKLLSKRLSSSKFFLIFGIFLFVFGATNYYRVRILSFKNAPQNEGTLLNPNEVPVTISIPSIEINLPIETASIKDGVWQISYDKATFLDSSQVPGKNGNIVIYGHNKKAIFGNLPYLSVGQQIIIKTKEGKEYKYEAYQKDFVSPDRVDLVSPTDYEELTIYTCWGLFDNQRVVIKAKRVF